MASNAILPILPIFLGVIVGIVFILILSVELSKIKYVSKLLATIGSHTFEIMAFSQIFIVLINKFLPVNVLLKYGLMAFGIFLIVKMREIINVRMLKK